jgi:hypothetical protein
MFLTHILMIIPILQGNEISLQNLLDNATVLLNNTHTQLKTNIVNIQPSLYFKRACPSDVNFGDYNYNLGINPLFNNTPVNENFTIFKKINDNKPLNLIKAIDDLTPVFKNNLEEFNRSTWQYIGSDKIFGVYPAFNWSNCSGYFPPSRPWYTSSTVGKGNFVLLLDITSGKNIN